MAIVKKETAKPAAAPQEEQGGESPKGNKPEMWLKMAIKGADGKYIKSVPFFGLYIKAEPANEHIADGNLKLSGKADPNGTGVYIPPGAIVEMNTHKLFEALGLKVKINKEGEVSVQEA